MTTFSQLVDEVVLELLRPDMTVVIAQYANQTIREMHSRPATNAPVYFDANRNEDELTVTTDSPWLWEIPSMTRFQKLETVYCPDLDIYLEARQPRMIHQASYEPYAEQFYYRTGTMYAFAGLAAGMLIHASYFMYPRVLAYKATNNRVVRFNPDTDSYEQIANPGTPATEPQLELETNWLLQRHDSTIREGVRAKIWKRIGDDSRTRTAYSAFESARTAVWNTEPSSM